MAKGIRIDSRRMGGATPVSTHGASKGLPMIHTGVQMRLTLTYRYDLKETLNKRRMAKKTKEANIAVMQYWHKEIRPKHFTHAGFTEYGYQRRSRATIHTKKKLWGHNDPIKDSGLAMAMSSNIKSLRATPSTGSVTVAGPWYMAVRVKRKDGKMSPDLKSELARVSKRDAMNMARFGAKHLRASILQDRKDKLGAKTEKP